MRAAPASPGERRRPVAAVAVGLILAQLGFLLYRVQLRIDEMHGEYRSTEEILYVEDGELLRKVLLGFDNLAADLYWLRAVQYFGGKRREATEKRFELLEPLLSIATSLDPQLRIAYSYGALFLSEPFPQGAGLPLRGIALVDKGIQNNPEHWRFYLDKGFIYFWYLEDYPKAAEAFLAGSKLPGAPYWMTAIAGSALTRGGERETSRSLWRILYETAENEQMRGNALVHLQQLDAYDQIDALNRLVGDYRERAGRFPSGWEELVAARLLPGVPLDPAGTPYVLNPREQKVELSIDSTLSGVP